MAARENQGYLIGIIVLVICTVILLLTTVFSTMKAYDGADKATAAANEAAYQGALAKAYQAEVNMMSACLGVGGKAVSEAKVELDSISRFRQGVDSTRTGDIDKIAAEAAAIYEIYLEDMALNKAVGDDGEAEEATATQTWKGTIEKLSAALRSTHNSIFVKNREASRIQDDADTKIATMQNKLDERDKSVARLESDLAKEKKNSALKEEELRNQALALQEAMDTLAAEADDDRAAKEQIISEINQEKKGLIEQNIALKEKVNTYEKEVFDLPDGRIDQVSPSTGSVVINIGRADGVRPNRTFAVYDQTVNNFEKDRHKAMIEVTEVLNDRQSVARVTLEDPKNPILTKDFILTATWDPGFSVPIALGGFFDLDKDGISDLEKLKRMIVRNGGRVVAFHDQDGNVTGEIDSSTRFFVLGPSPPNGASGTVKAMAAMKEQAEGNTVQVIDLRKLLNWMGVHGKASIERLDQRIGEKGGIGGFQPRNP
jgi:hypothetical protein